MEKFQRLMVFGLMIYSVELYAREDKPLNAIFILGLSIYQYLDYINRYK